MHIAIKNSLYHLSIEDYTKKVLVNLYILSLFNYIALCRNKLPKPILGVLFTVIIMAASPIASSYASDADYPDVKNAKVETNDDEISEAIIKTHGHISKDGEGGAFGYAVITDEGF